MFKKLLSNLPFNPSLLGQVSFYTQRLRRESFVRGAGVVMVVMALVIQTFAVISPPEPTLAKSPNDIVYGGFTTRDQAVLYCLDQNKDIHLIFEYYGLTCDIIANASTVTIKSTDSGKQLDSLGRVPQPANNPKNGKPSEQYGVKIPGVEQLYMKNLWYWDSYASSSYKVLKMTNKHGNIIYIMYDCGNIVTIGKYSPPPPPAPKPEPVTPVTKTPVVKPPVVTVTDTCPKIPGTQTSKDMCDVCPNIPGEQSSQNECYPCPAAQTDSEVTACLTFDKTASNQTRGIANAHNTTANAGDVITYTLTAKNTGKIDFKDFVFDENLADVLEYAEMNDFGGGTLNPSQHLVWPKRTIPANGSIKVQFNVKVKSPIPSTPQSSSDPGSYDLCMVNVFYGETVTICVKPPVSKQVEVVATTLPKTGPGTSIMISLVVISLMGYFFARNKLMVDELEIVRDEFATGGAA